MPSFTVPQTADAWFPRLDLDSEEVLVADETEMSKVMDAIRNREAPVPMRQSSVGQGQCLPH